RLDLAQMMLDARIRCELGETEPAQLVRRDAVASEEAVRDEGDRVARSVAVEQGHPPAGASEVQRGGESGRAGTDDDHIGVGVHKRFRSLSSRASVDSLPRISIDSNSGGLIRLPLIAVRSGPKAARGLSPAPSTRASRSTRSSSECDQSFTCSRVAMAASRTMAASEPGRASSSKVISSSEVKRK